MAREPRPPELKEEDTEEETGLMSFRTRMKGSRRRLGTFAFTALALLLLTCVS